MQNGCRDEVVVAALEAYVLGPDAAEEVRAAFRAGLRIGRDLSTLSTGGLPVKGTRSNGHVGVSPLRDPPFTPPSLKILSIPDPDPDPDLRSIERADCVDAGEPETLELFPRRVPLMRRRKLRCQIPADFTLTPRLHAFAEAGGLNPAEELAAMKDHYRGTGQTRADWSATFREWCRHSFDRTRRGRRA